MQMCSCAGAFCSSSYGTSWVDGRCACVHSGADTWCSMHPLTCQWGLHVMPRAESPLGVEHWTHQSLDEVPIKQQNMRDGRGAYGTLPETTVPSVAGGMHVEDVTGPRDGPGVKGDHEQ